MKRAKRKRWVVVLVIVLLLLCVPVVYYTLYPKKLVKLILPDFSKVEEVDGTIRNDSLHLNARGLFESESFLPLIVDSLWYAFYVQDCVLYSHKKQVNLKLAPGESDTVNIAIHVPFDRIRRLSEYIEPMDSIVIGVSCEVVYKYFGRHIRLKFDKSGKILRPVPPRIKLAGIRKKKITDWGKNIETEAELLVINDNKKLHVSVTGLEYEIQIGDKIKGYGRYRPEVELEPNTTQVVRIPVSLEINRPLKTAYELVFKKDRVNYTLRASGVLDFHAKKHPGIKVDLTAAGDADFSLKDKN